MKTAVENGTRRWPSPQARQDTPASALLPRTFDRAPCRVVIPRRSRGISLRVHALPQRHAGTRLIIRSSLVTAPSLLIDNESRLECDPTHSKQRTGFTFNRQRREASRTFPQTTWPNYPNQREDHPNG